MDLFCMTPIISRKHGETPNCAPVCTRTGWILQKCQVHRWRGFSRVKEAAGQWLQHMALQSWAIKDSSGSISDI